MKKIDYRGWLIPLILLLIWLVVSAKQWVDPALLAPPQAV